MTNPRRSFIRSLAAVSSMAGINGLSQFVSSAQLQESLRYFNTTDAISAVTNEEHWASVRQAFTINPNIINLNNGGVSPQPKIVQDAVDRYYRYSNEGPTYYMWRILDQGREPLRNSLAKFAGCDPGEIAINRNATEALDNVIFGLDLKPGDEVVMTKQDYPNMIQAWRQRELRDGIVIKWLDLDLPQEDDTYFINAFESAITSKTKVLHITDMINWTGQLLPTRQICAMARRKGIFSIVDGAHTFAHIDFKISDLECDAYGTSLHKWLCAPFGTGLLYIRKEKISEIWPLIPNADPRSGDIRKFEAIGTRSFAPEQAISTALDFHLAIGSSLKQQRLYYLTEYWVKEIKDLPGIRLFTPLNPKYACALFNIGLEKMNAGEFHNRLFDKFKIHTSPIQWEKINGVRITPHLYTSLRDLDKLIDAITQLSKA